MGSLKGEKGGGKHRCVEQGPKGWRPGEQCNLIEQLDIGAQEKDRRWKGRDFIGIGEMVAAQYEICDCSFLEGLFCFVVFLFYVISLSTQR